MKCYKCKAELTDKDFCEYCGSNVSVYKKILRTSNAYYNDGLEKAKYRELSLAAASLRRSLKYNKYNIDARNLLGLVYYEMGDTIHALAEWVISRSFDSDDNAANEYLHQLQDNRLALERAKQAIVKYNLAVNYANTKSEDLAVIQLKKVLSLNPKMLSAYQLLALLYMKNKDYTKAKKTLRKAQQIDTNNKTSLSYLREVERLYTINRGNPENLMTAGTNRDRVSYQSGNDTVIQPTSSIQKGRSVGTIVYLVAGICIGLAVSWFLILPAQKDGIRQEYKEREQQIYSKLEVQKEEKRQTEEPKETGRPDASENPHGTGQPDAGNHPSTGSAAFDLTHEEIYGDVSTMQLDDSMTAEDYFKRGSELYDYGDYQTAVSNLQKALKLDDKHLMSLYYLGRAYQMQDIYDKATVVFERIIELYPGHELAGDAERFIGDIQEESGWENNQSEGNEIGNSVE